MNNRIEILRNYIDANLAHVYDRYERRSAFIHLYGVAQACALIALKRGENVELATMAGMLHDYYSYLHSDPINHGEKGAELARKVLTELELTQEAETDKICQAIFFHCEKGKTHDSFTDVLIDADVMQHSLYNMTKPIMEHEKERFDKMAKEFALDHK